MIIVRQFTAPVCWASPMQFRPCCRRLPADFFDPFHLSPSLCRAKIIILWNSEKAPPSRSKWPPMPVPLTVTDGKRKVSVCFHSTRVWATVTPTVSHFDCLSSFFFFFLPRIFLTRYFILMPVIHLHIHLSMWHLPSTQAAFISIPVSHSHVVIVALAKSSLVVTRSSPTHSPHLTKKRTPNKK